ncbi:phosphonate C-P lyase system protein PhnH [soil metagenome]
MRPLALQGGFAGPSVEAARAFRALLDVMARPGRIAALTGATPPGPLGVAAGVLALTLLDAETPVWLAPPLAGSDLPGWLAFHTGAPVTSDKPIARFAFGDWPDLLPLDGFALGSADYPDRSATLIAELPGLAAEGARLAGPGIAGEARLALPDMAPASAARGPYPLGIDIFFTAGTLVAGLPRTTRIG